ncbi:DUF397 domain-containing protein [Actinoalloteichus fjordicus]|uniref:DUF397 family protein n=1 Tax=Actinoalloteichus fjordicus TaxID=1612552 RepID=A0AAC9PRH7_9PSEU|nr:DUF397 domain-containing protein [Actinoalloteichus fjordicus]APU14060.1 putative DUF397 family protein [Actinoalloteichus fjordicus]
MTEPLELRRWRKSSRSAHKTNCVEIGQAPGFIGIRDTKNRDGGTLIVDHTTFTTFLNALRADRLG